MMIGCNLKPVVSSRPWSGGVPKKTCKPKNAKIKSRHHYLIKVTMSKTMWSFAALTCLMLTMLVTSCKQNASFLQEDL